MQPYYLPLKSFSAISLVLATAIFALDLSLPLGVAGGVPYVALVLTALWAPRRRYILVAALLGSALTLVGWFLSPPGGIEWVATTNRGFTLFAIWVAAVLVLNRRVHEERTLRTQGEAEIMVTELEALACTNGLAGTKNFSMNVYATTSIILAVAIFALDLSLPLGVAGGVPYVALVLVALWAPRRRYILIAAGVGSLLTLAGWFLSPPGGVEWVVATNRALAIFAIWATAILGLNRRVYEERLSRAKNEADLLAAELETMAYTDSLTGIYNRHHFDNTLSDEWNRARRHRLTISLIILDVDFFKNYNDNYGHQAGDSCLGKIATTLKRFARRPGDLAARYGGEEFALILPGMETKNAVLVAQNLREHIESLAITHDHSGVSSVVTASMGVATLVPQSDMAKAIIVELADKALYKAKNDGRNRVVVAD